MTTFVRNSICIFFCFAILFFYFFPIDFHAIPISVNRIMQMLGLTLFMLAFKGKLYREIVTVCLLAIFVFGVGLLSSYVINGTNDLNFALIRGPYLILYVVYSYLIVWIMRKMFTQQASLYLLLELCVYISLIYATISILFFLIPDFLSWYKTLIVLDDAADKKIDLISLFRLFGASPNMSYANAAVHMGISMWMSLLLHKENFGFLSSKLLFYLVVGFFSVTGILFARTYFVMFALTIVYIYKLDASNLYRTFIDGIKVYLPICLLGMVLLLYLISTNEAALNWVFELFINFFDEGKISSDSTDDLQNMVVFPDNMKTWLVGDGLALTSTNSFYKDTDIGFLRSLFYWGIMGSVVYYGGMVILYKLLEKRVINNQELRSLFFMILLWFWIYNLKEFWSPAPYFILFLIASLYLPIRSDNKTCKVFL